MKDPEMAFGPLRTCEKSLDHRRPLKSLQKVFGRKILVRGPRLYETCKSFLGHKTSIKGLRSLRKDKRSVKGPQMIFGPLKTLKGVWP